MQLLDVVPGLCAREPRATCCVAAVMQQQHCHLYQLSQKKAESVKVEPVSCSVAKVKKYLSGNIGNIYFTVHIILAGALTKVYSVACWMLDWNRCIENKKKDN